MTDNKMYIDKVAEKVPSVKRTCRPAIALFTHKGTDNAFEGFIIGDKYFINAKTFDIYDKSVFSLINYLDEFSNEE